MHSNRRFDLVIFDCDGTLLDSEDASDGIISGLMADLGMTISPEEVQRRTQGMSDRDVWTLFGRELGNRVPPQVKAKYLEMEAAALRSTAVPMPGVEHVLERLVRDHQTFCIASSGTKAKMRISLRVTGLAKYFPRGSIFSASQVRHGKPAPDLFLLAAARMGVLLERCAVIEDSVFGVRAGVAAGMSVFAFCPRGLSKEHAAAGGLVFERMEDLTSLLS